MPLATCPSAKQSLAESKLSISLDYVFGRGTSRRVDCKELRFDFSRKTGRVRYALDGSGKVLFTFRADGSIAPTVVGALTLLGNKGKTKLPMKMDKARRNLGRPRWVVTVLDGVSEFVAQGKTVFCRHVVSCDSSLLANEDVAILNEAGELLGVGKTTVPGRVMKQFKIGVAVKVREGIKSKHVATALA